MTLDPAERLARLRLARMERVGPVAHERLRRRFGSASAALEAWREWAPQGVVPPSVAAAEEELDRVERLGGRTVFVGEDAYPRLLAAVRQPPPLLHLIGRRAPPARAVAIVGARNASAAGQRMAHQLASAAAAAGWLVVSGLARGIDAAAHRGALDAGGLSLACLAGGPDVAYPPEHQALMAEIGASGWLVSEHPPATQPTQHHFPRRNRLIAGLAQATLVVEAAVGSGSLITARLAGEEGRDVLAVPGHPLDPRARGANRLLKEGAQLIEDADDLLAALDPFGAEARQLRSDEAPAPPPELALQPSSEPEPTAEARRNLDEAGALALLGQAPVELDWLSHHTGLSAAELGRWLTQWELEGLVERLPGNRVARAAGVAARQTAR